MSPNCTGEMVQYARRFERDYKRLADYRIGSRGKGQQTLTFEWVKYGKVRHESPQTPASGDTNSRKWLQVAGVQGVLVAPLDQESPG